MHCVEVQRHVVAHGLLAGSDGRPAQERDGQDSDSSSATLSSKVLVGVPPYCAGPMADGQWLAASLPAIASASREEVTSAQVKASRYTGGIYTGAGSFLQPYVQPPFWFGAGGYTPVTTDVPASLLPGQASGTSLGFAAVPSYPGYVGDLVDPEASIDAAHELYKAGDYVRALEVCSAACAVQPHRTDAVLLMSAVHYQLQNFAHCISYSQQAIHLKPHLAEAHSNLANALQKVGQLDAAITHYRKAIQFKPAFTDAYNNLASALVRKGFVAQAVQCYALAINIDPSLFVVHSNLGDLWRAQGIGGREAAEHCYLQALHHNKNYAPAWLGLGELYRMLGQPLRALPCFQQVLACLPTHAEAFSGMGACYKAVKQLAEAEQCYHAAAGLAPGSVHHLSNLADVYYQSGKLLAAIEIYREAIKVDPGYAEAYNNLSNALRELGCLDDAAHYYMVCIRVQCGLPPGASVFTARPLVQTTAAVQRLCVVLNNLGSVFKLLFRSQESLASFQQIVVLQPGSAEAHANLAMAYKDFGKHSFALMEYHNALVLRPDLHDAFANYVHTSMCVCRWQGRDELFARLESEVRYQLAVGTLPKVQPFHMMAYPFPSDLVLEVSRAYARHCSMSVAKHIAGQRLAHPRRAPIRWVQGERLRVAYVSSDFGNHPLSHLMASVFGFHDASRVEVFCYALSHGDGSEWRQKIEAEAEHFLDVSAWSAVDIARRISSDGVHVALNLNGYTKGARNEIFALQPAPVQCSYMGFPATTGADFMQYLITDKVVAPRALHHCYSEQLAVMPNCYFVNDYKQAHVDVLNEDCSLTRSQLGLPEGKVVFSCSNQLYKYDPETFASWCRILRRVPDSVLWLLRFPADGEANIHAEAKRWGVGPGRIIFTDVTHKEMHIRRSALADVFLDTPYCNAHTTGCDVLWSGCPMVTLPLERMASRVASSLCHAAGCPEMVAGSHEEYEDLACRLGTDHVYRKALRDKLMQGRLSSPLFDTRGWVRDFERVLFKMWDIHAKGMDPHTFELS